MLIFNHLKTILNQTISQWNQPRTQPEHLTFVLKGLILTFVTPHVLTNLPSIMTLVPMKKAFPPPFVAASTLGHSLFQVSLSFAVESSPKCSFLDFRTSEPFAFFHIFSFLDHDMNRVSTKQVLPSCFLPIL